MYTLSEERESQRRRRAFEATLSHEGTSSMFGKKRAANADAEAKETGRARRAAGAAAFEIVASVQTDKGCVREINEDSGRHGPARPTRRCSPTKGMLVVVADGMGGHAAGEVASQMAVDVVSRLYYETRARARHEALKRRRRGGEPRRSTRRRRGRAKHGMGTTCTALALLRRRGLRRARRRQPPLHAARRAALPADRRPLGGQRDGQATASSPRSEARTHEDKNVILRALGTDARGRGLDRRALRACARATATCSARTGSTTSSATRRSRSVLVRGRGHARRRRAPHRAGEGARRARQHHGRASSQSCPRARRPPRPGTCARRARWRLRDDRTDCREL